MGVPRVWEKFKDNIELQMNQASGFKGFVLEKSKVGVACIQHIDIFYPCLCDVECWSRIKSESTVWIGCCLGLLACQRVC